MRDEVDPLGIAELCPDVRDRERALSVIKRVRSVLDHVGGKTIATVLWQHEAEHVDRAIADYWAARRARARARGDD